MNATIRSATAADSATVAEIYYQAYQNLSWFQHVNAEADPEAIKAFVQTIVHAILKNSGVVLVAEKDGQAVGCLMGWERASDAAVEANPAFPNPYYDPGVTVNIRGRVLSRWINQQAEIRKFSGQIGTQQGRFFYVDSVAVLPQYQRHGVGRSLLQAAVDRAQTSGLSVGLVSPSEAVSFVQRLGLQETGNTITSQDDNRFQLTPMALYG